MATKRLSDDADVRNMNKGNNKTANGVLGDCGFGSNENAS